MIKTFINDVLFDLKEKDVDLSQLTFILPSKRAGNFLKNAISSITNKTLFSPEILSVEAFIENVSLLKTSTNTDLLFELYHVYLSITKKEQIEPFDSFCKWAQVILQDFNEIDRYLIPQKEIFNYLSAIKELDHWSLSDEKTDIVINYLSFWEKLPIYYKEFTERLIAKDIGYQGLLYREAVEKLELYTQHNKNRKHIFLGFNALNAAEQKIIQELLHQGLADIYWDIDAHFMNVEYHDAGLFGREHMQWEFYKKNAFKWKASNYTSEKNIHVIGCPKNVGQAKHVGELVAQLKNSNNSLINTAVVLGDETLLTPVLNSIPKDIGPVNITMGLPMHLVPLASLFNALFLLHKTNSSPKLYYKDVISITSSSFIASILNVDSSENIILAHNYISKNNITFIALDKIKELFQSNIKLIDALFGNWQNSSKTGLENCKKIIQKIKVSLSKEKNHNLLTLEYLFKFNQIFNQLELLLYEYDYAKDIKTLFSLYKEIQSTETIDFQGEPLKGLQIIGTLESRVIDFDTVIITSVNEGILPSGKSNNSFIPFDVKLQYGLPTYKEKDAVYAYHFYHLLQRAKNIYILYNTEVDALNGGEKSRFITQLEVEGIHDPNYYTISPEVPKIALNPKVVKKTNTIIDLLKSTAAKGFSPSSLTSYIRNPMDFYYQKILGINTFETVEETVADNTFGTIIHNTLEDLYTPFLGKFLTKDDLSRMTSEVATTINKHFVREFRDGDTASGKNLIIFEISKRYISNFLNKELESLERGQKIKLVALEKKLEVPIDIPEVNFPVRLKGTVDRIDECDGVLRIIDYKTGMVTQGKVEIVDWEDIMTDYEKYSKSVQILTYAYMLYLETPFEKSVEAGIISFKNLKSGLLKFGKKDAPKSRSKDHNITSETLSLFSEQLKKLIIEICNHDVDFIEKDV